MKIESSMIKKLHSFYMLIQEENVATLIEEANIKHIKGNTTEERLTSILSNSQPFENIGKLIKKQMDTVFRRVCL